MTREHGIALAVAGCLVAAGSLDGGFSAVSWGWQALGLLVLAVAGALLVPSPQVTRRGLVVLGALCGLLLWQLASLAWTTSIPLTALEPQHTVVLIAGVAAGLLWCERDDLEAMAAGILLGAALICTWNLLSRRSAGTDTGADAAPIGYTNALALLAVVGILLAAGIAVERRAPVRVAAAVCAVPCLVVIVLSQSRGAQAALAIGALAAWCGGQRAQARVLATTAVGLALLFGLALAASVERSAYWAVAVSQWERTPLLGSGGGTWGRVWLEHRGEPFPAVDAHSLYLQVLSELGPVGLVLVGLALIPPLLTAARARRPITRVVLGAYVAFVVHLGVDFDWQLTAVSLTGLTLGVALLAHGERVAAPALPIVTAAGVTGVVVALLLTGNTLAEQASSALRGGDAFAAAAAARRATWLQPWSGEPWRLRGEAARALGRPTAAASFFRDGIERDPGDVELWRALARVSTGIERRRAGIRAARLDPFGASPTR